MMITFRLHVVLDSKSWKAGVSDRPESNDFEILWRCVGVQAEAGPCRHVAARAGYGKGAGKDRGCNYWPRSKGRCWAMEAVNQHLPSQHRRQRSNNHRWTRQSPSSSSSSSSKNRNKRQKQHHTGATQRGSRPILDTSQHTSGAHDVPGRALSDLGSWHQQRHPPKSAAQPTSPRKRGTHDGSSTPAERVPPNPTK